MRDIWEVSIRVVVISLLMSALALLEGCSAPKVHLWQDEAGGSNPYTATVRCRPSAVSHTIDVRSPSPQVVREVEE